MTSTARLARRLLAVALLGLAAAATARAEEKEDLTKPSFEVYGFAQADYIQDFNRVDPAWKATLRASKIPTTAGVFGSNGQATVSARQSRLGAQGRIPNDGDPVFAKFEFDMFGVGADEGKTTIRLRHAYGTWRQLLAGQTHSLFMDVDVFPDVLDYWGPSGMVFLRNPQLRWTPLTGEPRILGGGKTTFAIAIEQPTSDLDVGSVRNVDPSLGAAITTDDKMPDVTWQVHNEQKWGHLQLAGIFRRVGFETTGTPGNDPAGHDFGWGLDATTVVKTMGKDKAHLGLVYGHGIANYMNDGGVDMAPKSNGLGAKGVAVPLIGYILYYDHWWNDKWESTAGYSRTQVENQDKQAGTSFHSVQYASANIVYKPNPEFFIGGELLWGQRADVSGAVGIDRRMQVSAHYNFSSKGLVAQLTGSQK